MGIVSAARSAGPTADLRADHWGNRTAAWKVARSGVRRVAHSAGSLDCNLAVRSVVSRAALRVVYSDKRLVVQSACWWADYSAVYSVALKAGMRESRLAASLEHSRAVSLVEQTAALTEQPPAGRWVDRLVDRLVALLASSTAGLRAVRMGERSVGHSAGHWVVCWAWKRADSMVAPKVARLEPNLVACSACLSAACWAANSEHWKAVTMAWSWVECLERSMVGNSVETKAVPTEQR